MWEGGTVGSPRGVWEWGDYDPNTLNGIIKYNKKVGKCLKISEIFLLKYSDIFHLTYFPMTFSMIRISDIFLLVTFLMINSCFHHIFVPISISHFRTFSVIEFRANSCLIFRENNVPHMFETSQRSQRLELDEFG